MRMRQILHEMMPREYRLWWDDPELYRELEAKGELAYTPQPSVPIVPRRCGQAKGRQPELAPLSSTRIVPDANYRTFASFTRRSA